MPVPRLLKLGLAALAGSAALTLVQHWSAIAQDRDVIEVVEREVRLPTTVPAATAAATPATGTAAAPRAATLTMAAHVGAAGQTGTPDRAQAILATGARAFAVHHWVRPAPPPPPVAVAPPAPEPVIASPVVAVPVAPPLPFVFVGMLEKGLGQRPQAFIAKGETLLVVGAGDLLENKTYRIETLNPQEVVMTYMPLDLRQSLYAAGAAK
jgi:hypothetical protein